MIVQLFPKNYSTLECSPHQHCYAPTVAQFNHAVCQVVITCTNGAICMNDIDMSLVALVKQRCSLGWIDLRRSFLFEPRRVAYAKTKAQISCAVS